MKATLESFIRRDHTTISWSGGTTTELAIYPATAKYKQGNYLWRLSTATMEADTSVFSALPGVARTLMLLDGQISLRHKGHHESRLQPFDQDCFDGGWTTHCQGRGRDFNLMCADGVEGELAALPIARHDARPESFGASGASSPTWVALYCVDGDLTLGCEGEYAPLRRGDILVADIALLPSARQFMIENPSDQTGVIIRCTIRTQPPRRENLDCSRRTPSFRP